jgi:hypothetical protein
VDALAARVRRHRLEALPRRRNPVMKCALPVLCSLLLLLAVASDAQQIESLPAEDAWVRVEAMRGVVLVDLYADW